MENDTDLTLIDKINALNETAAPGTSLDIEDSGFNEVSCISSNYNSCSSGEVVAETAVKLDTALTITPKLEH